MNGNRRFLLDTNAIVSLLAGNRKLSAQLAKAEYVGISVISYLEFPAFDALSDGDLACFESFCKRVDILSLSQDNPELIKLALDLRRNNHLKLPDAIIGATALTCNAILITNDSHFAGISQLPVQGCYLDE